MSGADFESDRILVMSLLLCSATTDKASECILPCSCTSSVFDPTKT